MEFSDSSKAIEKSVWTTLLDGHIGVWINFNWMVRLKVKIFIRWSDLDNIFKQSDWRFGLIYWMVRFGKHYWIFRLEFGQISFRLSHLDNAMKWSDGSLEKFSLDGQIWTTLWNGKIGVYTNLYWMVRFGKHFLLVSLEFGEIRIGWSDLDNTIRWSDFGKTFLSLTTQL